MVKRNRQVKEVSEEDLNLLDSKIIEFMTNNPQRITKEIEETILYFKGLNETMINNEGSVIPYDDCKNLLTNAFRLDYLIECIDFNYYSLELPSSYLDYVKKICNEGLTEFKKLKHTQKTNIDNPLFHGLDSIVHMDKSISNRPLAFYDTKKFKDTIYLKQAYKMKKKRVKKINEE